MRALAQGPTLCHSAIVHPHFGQWTACLYEGSGCSLIHMGHMGGPMGATRTSIINKGSQEITFSVIYLSFINRLSMATLVGLRREICGLLGCQTSTRAFLEKSHMKQDFIRRNFSGDCRSAMQDAGGVICLKLSVRTNPLALLTCNKQWKR